MVQEKDRLFVGIKYHLQRLEFPPNKKIVVNFSTDGLPLHGSGRGQRLWPMVMQIDGYDGVRVVSIYAGITDPTAEILVDILLLQELRELYEDGWNGQDFEIGFITCDLMAMAKLKGIKGPTGYDSCYKCTIHGYYNKKLHKMEFYASDAVAAPLRTNESFRDPEVDLAHHQIVIAGRTQTMTTPLTRKHQTANSTGPI